VTSTSQCKYPAGQFFINLRPELFVGKDVVQSAIGAGEVCTINALTADLHRGENPRYGRPGRIPGSVNVPAPTLFNPETKELLPIERVAQSFAGIGADPTKRIIVYCGGGIAATLDAFLLHELGYRDVSVYDNSLSEWANDASLPIETD
jgi:thiosulfate/3-mercaptopyruvate sulfurtransferase